MQIQLSQKERMILEDLKTQEEVCIQKYNNYSQQVQDYQLKQLCSKLAGAEQQHYNTINQLLQGQQPNLNQSQQGQQSQQNQQMQQTSTQNPVPGSVNQNDKMLCTDLLATEKHVSGNYDIGIFESASPQVRQTLQHIQQEEQKHGEELFNYMQSHGMYNVK
ncbi:hypothetical protein CPJCM30710_02870 [Clostridium polyendosporum]|uniref:Spore coat protein CotF n=1 Tax=Clostridium polyendosporum TaxID=69208 RepID=A0A919RWD8_9CLOT|nr:spore coat protein [Clostridium polyendosporum]GIM27621.1 hypothetical protein CPJCM30710_02870 [Clostridium polyendosporum]